MFSEMIGYRMVEFKNGTIYSPFHSTNGSKKILLDTWHDAEKKIVRDGNRSEFYYLSGWHFFKNRQDCEVFFITMIRKQTNRIIVKCEVDGEIRQKRTDGKGMVRNVYLADKILIPSSQFNLDMIKAVF